MYIAWCVSCVIVDMVAYQRGQGKRDACSSKRCHSQLLSMTRPPSAGSPETQLISMNGWQSVDKERM